MHESSGVGLRYYLYISNAKVDMLLPQVPGAMQQKVSTKFGFDIKVLSGSLSAERATLDNRVSRLVAVEEYLIENESVGEPDQRTPWIRGTAEAKFVDIGHGGVLFVMATPSGILALGGSEHHLVGASAPEQVQIPMSFMPEITKQLVKWAEEHPEAYLRSNEDVRKVAPGAREFMPWTHMIHWVLTSREGDQINTQRIEFLAKRLLTTVEKGDTYTLASPLFVSSAE